VRPPKAIGDRVSRLVRYSNDRLVHGAEDRCFGDDVVIVEADGDGCIAYCYVGNGCRSYRLPFPISEYARQLSALGSERDV